MSYFEAAFNAHLGAAQQKEDTLDAKAQQKQDYLDPVFEFGVDEARFLDQDTVVLPNGERVRLSGGEGRTLDSYEADSPEEGISGAQKYADRPETFERHRQNYARAYGLDPDDVTVDDLVNAGNSQKVKAQERFRQMADENGRIRYRQRGQDIYGRTIGELDPGQVNLSGRQDNAAYYSPYNYEQALEDFASGERSEQSRGAGDRSVRTAATDQVVNFVGGAGRMANDLVQGAGTLVGLNNIPGVDEGHSAVREALESFKEWGNSPEQQRRERLEQERNEIQSEFYNIQRDKYIKEGLSETNASIRAGIDEFTNSVGNIIDNPGSILDKTVESLPYMLGVASAGRAATNAAVKSLQKQILKDKTVQKIVAKQTKGRFQTAEGYKNLAAHHTEAFLRTKKGQAYIKRVQGITGVSTVGLTEGLSTSAEVYDSVRNMTEEQALNSDKYIEMRNRGLTHDQATEQLAEEAHLQTLLTVTLAAGAASFLTGAGPWEAQLLTGLGGARKGATEAVKKQLAAQTATKTAQREAEKQAKIQAQKQAAKGVTRKTLEAAGRGGVKTAKFLGPASVKEGTEELLQSGGGEFLSQLAKFDATGEQVGPGVGRAAGEGAVIGAASGFGAQLTLGSLKALGTADPKKLLSAASEYKDKVDGRIKARQATAAATGATVAADGTTDDNTRPSTPPPPTTVEEQTAVDENPQETFQAALDDEATSNPVLRYENLKRIADRAAGTGKPLTEQQEQVLEIWKTMAHESLSEAARDIAEKDSKDVTDDDVLVLRKAAQLGVEGLNLDNLSEEQRDAVEDEVQLAEDFDAAQQTQNEIAGVDGDNRTAAQRVHDDKFGDVFKQNGRHGLGYYNRRMRELMNVLSPANQGTDENSELDGLFRGLSRFRGSQGNYLAAVREAIRTKADAPIKGTNKKVRYTEGERGGTEGLERLLMDEEAQFETIRDGLLKRYRQWVAGGQTTPIRNTADAGQAETGQAQEAQQDRQERRTYRQQRKADTVVEKDLRAERLQIKRDFPEITSVERRSALINLKRRVERTKDLELLDELIIDLRTVNARRREAQRAVREGRQTSDNAVFAEDVGGRRERTNAFTPRNEEEPAQGETETQPEAAPAPEPAPKPRKTLRQVTKEGVKATLSFIEELSTSDAGKALAKRVNQVIGDADTEIVELSDAQFKEKFGKSASGAYFEGKIYVNTARNKSAGKYRNTVLHEAIHHALRGHLKNGMSPELKDRLRNLNLEVVRALTANGGKYHLAMARILAANPEELLTHGIATPFLNEFLKQHKVGKTQTLLDKLIKFVADFLGIPNDSALHEVLSITEGAFAEVEAARAPVDIQGEVETTQAEINELAEAENEGAEAGAPAPAAATESTAEAEAEGNPDLETKAERDVKARRLSEARRLITMLNANRVKPNQLFLNHKEDAAFLGQLLEGGVPAVQALEQVMARIEPDPTARDLSLDPAVPQEVIDRAGVNAAQLNANNPKPVKARSFLKTLWDYAADLTGQAAAGVQKLFTQRKLGTKATDSWEQRSKVTRDLLASETQIMDILTDPASREIFFEQAGTTPQEERALRTFANFYTRFAEVLNETLEKERVANGAANQASQNPLYFFRDKNTGKINSNVAGAMALEAMQYLVGSGAQSINNTDDDIRGILGISDWAAVDPLARQILGSGTLQVNMTQEVGRKIFSHLNLKLKNEARPLGREVFESALGAQTLAVLTQLGTIKKQNGRNADAGTFIPRVRRIRVSRAAWNQLKQLHEDESPRTDMNRQIDVALENEGGDIILVTNMTDDSEYDAETASYPDVDVNKKMRDMVTEGRDIFQKLFASTATVRTPMFRKPNINDIPQKVFRTMSKIPEVMRERLLHDAQQHWQADTELLDMIEKFGDPVKYLRAVHGYLTEAEIEQLHVDLRDGARGRNRGLERDLMEALTWNRQYGDRKFYLPSKMIRSGRFLIDSNVINPQANKLHRFMFVRDKWTRSFTKGKLSNTEYQGLMMAIGLGMGIKTDYTPVAEVVDMVETAFTDSNSPWFKAMQAIQNVGDTFTDEDIEAIQNVALAEENTHTVAALHAAAKYFGAADGQTVTISLPHETDGVTNGYIIGLMSTPPLEGLTPEYKELLNAGGIYFDDDPWQNLAEYKAEGNLDNYQHIAQDTRNNLDRNTAEAKATSAKTLKDYRDARKIRDRIPGRNILIRKATSWVAGSGLVPSVDELNQQGTTEEERAAGAVGRKWAKDPLMVMSYGAGFSSVGRQIVSHAIETFYEHLAKAAHPEGREATAEEIATAMNRAFRIINMTVLANQKGNIPKIINDQETGETKFLRWRMQLTTNNRHTLTAADVQRLADQEFGGSLTNLATNFRLNADQRNLLATALNVTYGSAMGEALNTRLEPVLEVRGRLNAANQFVNMLYAAEYDRQVQELRDAGTIVTARHKQQIQEDLLAQGLVPSIATAESTGIDDSLEMTNYGVEYQRFQKNLLEGVAFLDQPAQLSHQYWGYNGQQRVPDKARTITGRATVRVPDADVGVSAVVKSIHALDGVINSLLWGMGKHAVLNVHDAQVSPWYAAAEVAANANLGFADTLANYDLPQQFLDTFNRIKGSLWGADQRLSKEVKDEIALQMAILNETFGITREAPDGTLEAVQAGYETIRLLEEDLILDQQNVHSGKADIFNKTRWINQFAQQGTEVSAPKGIPLNEDTNWAGDVGVTPDVTAQLSEDVTSDMDVLFAEDFQDQLESEKILNIWEGLAEWERGDVNPAHQSHLRNLIKGIVKPGLETMEPIFQEVLEGENTDGHQAIWDGDLLRLRASANTLSSNADISLQERAAQEYVNAIVSYGVENDHFVRKEVRRLFELAKETATVEDFLPAEIVGNPQIAYERALERYNHIFNNENPNEAYKAFLSIGLTNAEFAGVLSRLDNPGTSFNVPTWDKGILRGMLSIFRQIVEKLSGVGARHTGGTVADAVNALARTTIAVNQKNQQRLKDLRTGADGTSRINRINERIVGAVNRRFVDPLAKGLEAAHEKRLDPKNPTVSGFVKAATYTALKSRDSEVRAEYNRFYRELTTPYGVGKDNPFFETVAEVTPWAEENLDWIGLLRKSKYIVDMARQEASDHTRSFLNKSFDKSNYMSQAHKMAMTNTLLKTDLVSLLSSDYVDTNRLAELLRDPQARASERSRLETRLRQELAAQNADSKTFFLFQNQARSLANFMVNGETTVENGMLNAYNIVNQFMLADKDQVSLQNKEVLESIVDRMATMYALDLQTGNDLRLTNDIVQHEISRTDTADDGFTRLMGMHINFKELAKEKLFDGQPVQMIKGYVYEIFDGDVNIEYVEEGSDREAELIADGMQLVGPLPKDSHDIYKGRRLLYKGMKGLNTYNKSIVSLTDLQHRGANLFSTNGYQSQTALQNLAYTRQNSYLTATRQFQPDFAKQGTSMVPVLNNQGQIVDYRYMMTESNKRKVLKKEDPFDRVLPRMFASISDRNNTKVINQDVVNLLHQEYIAGRNDPGQRFVKVSRTSSDKAGRDMWNLLPETMQRQARAKFGFEGIYVRDDVANLVLGFRKATVSNIKKPGQEGGIIWGKNTPVVRMAEKVWLEVVSLMRIKIAILTPAVVVGNIASNTAMLLSEGIPLNYIRKNASEAISGMRQYQKDRQAATELMREIGSRQALGRDTRRLEVRLAQLNSELAANPVGQLVEQGLFTSITADLGVDDDTFRGSLIQKAEDYVGNRGGKAGKAVAHVVKEAYMLPGSKGYQAAVAATQYGDFVARYIKFKYDTQVRKKDELQAINEALSAFIYYDIPQPKYLQALNDSGLVMFTKFFLRIQPIVARMYTQNPASAFSVLALQKAMLPDPFNENIMNYGMGDGLTNKWNNPLNLPGKAWDTLNPTEPALLQWILNPFGL